MKRKILASVVMGLVAIAFAQQNDISKERQGARDKLSDKARVVMEESYDEKKESNNHVIGHVIFDGFDFEEYQPESEGLEPMLEATLLLLEDYYGESKQPFVFVGHSQGGLRALAMSTYLKEKNPALYKQLRGVITISGIDRGLELLENNGSVFRARLSADVNILIDGFYGLLKTFIPIPGDFVIGEIIKRTGGNHTTDLVKTLLGENWDFTSRYAYPILNNERWDEHAQIRDMVPQSDFIKKYVLEETTKTYQHKSKQESYKEIEWRKKWGWLPYPVIVTKYKPVYIKTKDVNMKIDKDLCMKYLAGTVSDAMALGKDYETVLTIGMHSAGTLFAAGTVVHTVKTATLIGLFTNSPVHAIDCGKASAWCFGYKNEISELLGGKIHDGLVTYDYQRLPTKSCQDTVMEKNILNNTEYKEYSHLNHFSMNKLYENDDLRPLNNPAKAYANLTVQEWLKD